MSETIKPKMDPLFKQKTPFYKTKFFKVFLILTFIILIVLAVFFLLGFNYSTQTLEKAI